MSDGDLRSDKCGSKTKRSPPSPAATSHVAVIHTRIQMTCQVMPTQATVAVSHCQYFERLPVDVGRTFEFRHG